MKGLAAIGKVVICAAVMMIGLALLMAAATSQAEQPSATSHLYDMPSAPHERRTLPEAALIDGGDALRRAIESDADSPYWPCRRDNERPGNASFDASARPSVQSAGYRRSGCRRCA